MNFLKYLFNWLLPLQETEWHDGYAPSRIPRSYITEGMYTCKSTGKIIPCWRYNENYYTSLLD